MWWALVAIAAVAAIYWKLVRPHKHWLKRGVKQGNPYFIMGDHWGPVLKKHSFAEMVEMVYNACPNTRYSGCYQFLIPTLVIKDPDLIKQVTVKDFDHFLDHRSFIPEGVDAMWSRNLFSLSGKKWRDMRSTLSPAFTGSKMKYMFSLISQSGEQFAKYFLEKNEALATIEMKEAFTRFTNDVIANTAFGIECNSLRDRENEFYLMGRRVTTFGFQQNLKIFGYLCIPWLLKSLKISFFTNEVTTFFTGLVKSNIQSRQKHNIVRPDMIHLLLEARNEGLKHEEMPLNEDTGFATVQESDVTKGSGKTQITDEDITAQALVFFFAGFDSVASLMCFMSYELGINPEVQDRLVKEVDDTFKACGGKLTYEAVVGMKYMDMVVSETLRKWPNAIASDRVCTKPYTIEPKNPGEKPLHLERGEVLWLPIFGLHRDPLYYPEPDRFDPERFNEENKKKINPYAYLPFGVGPRNCIGSRFALLETKTMFCYLLREFQIVSVEKTEIPLVLSKKQMNLTAEGGFWLGLKKRSKN